MSLHAAGRCAGDLIADARTIANRVAAYDPTAAATLRALAAQVERSAAREKPLIGDLVSLEDIERAHITAVLKRSETLADAATTLGIDTATLYRKRRRWGLR